MKRSMVLMFSCLALVGGTWLAHVVWGQATETKPPAEETYSITKSKLEEYVAKKVAAAVAAEREKAATEKPASNKPVSDEQVLKAENWHRAVFDKMEFVVYTGPGQAMMHHWIPQTTPAGSKPPASKSGTGTAPAAPKGN